MTTQNDLFTKLEKEHRRILLYGMGNGADKILTEMEKRHIPVAGIFASDGFVRGHCFHGMRVMSYSEVKEQYTREECVILLAFGSSRPEALSLFEQVNADFELLVPDMPVCGGPLFDAPYLQENLSSVTAARALLEDEDSRRVYDEIIAFRLSGEFSRLLSAVSEKDPWAYVKESKIAITGIADLGAYNGDSAREALSLFSPDLILAAEPDRRNFKKLSDWSESVTDCAVECHQVAICDRVGEAAFDDSGNRNAGLCTGRARTTVSTATLDSLLRGRRVDYVKYDVEGAEKEALLGSADTIRTHRPILRVALYHHSGDLFELPLLLREICPDYRFYLTRARSVPAWDIDLIAIPR